jgi:transmembrane sensor
MKDFRLYDITDFVMDEDFIRWVQEKKHSDEIFWENWLTQNPSKHLLVAEARQIVESVRTEERSIPPSEITNEIHRLLKTVKDQQPARLPPVRLPQRWLPAAAVLALVIATFLLFRPAKEKRSEKFDYPAIAASPSLLEKINTTPLNDLHPPAG